MSRDDLFSQRKGLDEICSVPDKIISVYSLEKHVWSESNAEASRKKRSPELKSIEEFQFDPVRPFLTDVFRNIAAPYKPDKKDDPIGQGYWIQAEFGSGKSHLLCVLSALVLGKQDAWSIVKKKEDASGRGKRESLYRFWEEGIQSKSGAGTKGIFVAVKTLVGSGSGTVGLNDQGKKLTEYILDAVKEQLQIELGKNISLYPSELLADRFLKDDIDRYRADLKKFLKDSRYFEEDEFEDLDDFVRDIQQNKSPEYKRSCGNKLWRFYTEYLRVQPHIAAESEEILKYMVETVLHEGYSGVLLVLDEVSLFMKNRDENQRTEDEKTLVILSNRLAKVHNLPVWTICSAQQAIESKMGVKNIIADDRLKLVKLLEEDKDYYDIVLARVRSIKDDSSIGNYYLHYKRGFTWPNSIGETEFRHFFPFHKPAIEVLRAITYELTTTRSAIHFMHQTLKHLIKQKGKELIRLWELFDEAVRYEEDPSGVHAGLVAIKTKKEIDYRAYESCRRQIDGLTKGLLKAHRDKVIKIIQTLFLYHIAKTRQQGLVPEEISNSVLIERDESANPDENNQHYETLADNLKKELRQIVQSFDDDGRPRYRFDPVFTGVDPRDEFRKSRDEVESNESLQKESWERLISLSEWPVRTRHMTIDLSNGVHSPFYGIVSKDETVEIFWHGRQVSGLLGMRDFNQLSSKSQSLPVLDTEQSDHDFAVYVGKRASAQSVVQPLLSGRKDPRVIVWVPDELNSEEKQKLFDFAAYRKLVSEWEGKDSDDAVAVINWVASSLQSDIGRIMKIVEGSYSRGRVDALNNSQMSFHMAGELPAIITPLVDKVLESVYESRAIKFDPPINFKWEDAVKVINGIVKTGSIPRGAKPNQNISAAQNFGFGLFIMNKKAERELDTKANVFVKAMRKFIEEKLTDDRQTMKIDTIYKNFMGIGGVKNYGLNRRIAQLYLLCLAREGVIKIGLNAKSGLPLQQLDYSNIADVDFSAKILDSLTDIQKLARPENWDTLRLYAAIILGEEIPATHDDAVISGHRERLRKNIGEEKDRCSRTVQQAKDLFDFLKCPNPYEKELTQAFDLFSVDLNDGDDIDRMLFALKNAYGYKAFDDNTANQQELDDFANRMKNYRDLVRFVGYESELRTAGKYAHLALPEGSDYKRLRKSVERLREKLSNIREYIDSDVKLKTELIGKIPPEPGETATVNGIVNEYTQLYNAAHDTVLNALEESKRAIRDILESDEMSSFQNLEAISAMQPPISGAMVEHLETLLNGLFACSSPSRLSVEEELRRETIHVCGMTLAGAAEIRDKAVGAAVKAKSYFDDMINRKFEVFINPTIKARLEQGKSEPLISRLLKCSSGEEVRALFMKESKGASKIPELINRYLKRIVIRQVRLADFSPSLATIEKDQIKTVALEFERFLEGYLTKDDGDDSLPIIQIEK